VQFLKSATYEELKVNYQNLCCHENFLLGILVRTYQPIPNWQCPLKTFPIFEIFVSLICDKIYRMHISAALTDNRLSGCIMFVGADCQRREAYYDLTTVVPYQGSCRLWAPRWQASSVRTELDWLAGCPTSIMPSGSRLCF